MMEVSFRESGTRRPVTLAVTPERTVRLEIDGGLIAPSQYTKRPRSSSANVALELAHMVTRVLERCPDAPLNELLDLARMSNARRHDVCRAITDDKQPSEWLAWALLYAPQASTQRALVDRLIPGPLWDELVCEAMRDPLSQCRVHAVNRHGGRAAVARVALASGEEMLRWAAGRHRDASFATLHELYEHGSPSEFRLVTRHYDNPEWCEYVLSSRNFEALTWFLGDDSCPVELLRRWAVTEPFDRELRGEYYLRFLAYRSLAGALSEQIRELKASGGDASSMAALRAEFAFAEHVELEYGKVPRDELIYLSDNMTIGNVVGITFPVQGRNAESTFVVGVCPCPCGGPTAIEDCECGCTTLCLGGADCECECTCDSAGICNRCRAG